MEQAGRKILLCYQTSNTVETRNRHGKKCLLLSSTSLPERRGGQLTFMETLFLDCSLAGVHYSSAVHCWNILLRNVSVCKWGLGPHSHVMFCQKLLQPFFLTCVTCCLCPAHLRVSREMKMLQSISSDERATRTRTPCFHSGTHHFEQPWLNEQFWVIPLCWNLLMAFPSLKYKRNNK